MRHPIFRAADRVEDAIKRLAALQESLRPALPMPSAEAELDYLEDDLMRAADRLKRAYAVLDGECERLEQEGIV